MAMPSVLCVDDEPFILHSLKRMMRREGYTLLTARNALDGLAILEKELVHLVISDQRMPEMTGIEFLQKVKELSPHTIRVILSGNVDIETIVDAINKGEVYRFLNKPWNDDELRVAVRQCLEHYTIVEENQRLLEQVQKQNQELLRLNGLMADAVEQRTRSLLLARDVVARVPVPVIEIGRGGRLELANEAANQVTPFLNEVGEGQDVRPFLPESVADAVAEVLAGVRINKRIKCDWFGRTVCARVLPLQEGHPEQGCLLLLAGEVICSTLSGCDEVNCPFCRFPDSA